MNDHEVERLLRNPRVLIRGRGKVAVVAEAEIGGMHGEDGERAPEPRNAGILPKGKEMTSPPEPPEGIQLCQHLEFSP